MDITTIAGIILGVGGILLGQVLEGGHISSIMQSTAAFIVFGGTWGAVLACFPSKDVVRGFKLVKLVFTEKKEDLGAVTKLIVELASVARRDGVLALESKLGEIEDPFLKKALTYVVDGVDANVARSSLEASIEAEHGENVMAAKVWESAGGFAPTIGIIGAVLGLIHVMENLSDPSKLGGGIAVAFVATVYGVGSANLFYLPFATKLKRKFALAMERKMIITEGVLAIQEGLNPRVLEEKLRALTGIEAPPAAAKKAA